MHQTNIHGTVIILSVILLAVVVPTLSIGKKYWNTEELLAGPPRADDERIIEFVRSKGFLIQPSDKPYKLRRGILKRSDNTYVSIVKKILNNKVPSALLSILIIRAPG